MEWSGVVVLHWLFFFDSDSFPHLGAADVTSWSQSCRLCGHSIVISNSDSAALGFQLRFPQFIRFNTVQHKVSTIRTWEHTEDPNRIMPAIYGGIVHWVDLSSIYLLVALRFWTIQIQRLVFRV